MQVFLSIHILGALITVALVTVSAISLLKNYTRNYKKLFWLNNLVASVQIGSGVGLITTSPHVSLISFCAGLGAYLSALVFVQSLILLRSKKLQPTN